MLRSAVRKLSLVTLSLILSFSSLAQDNALEFDGVNDHILVPNDASFNDLNSGTIEAWVRTSTVEAAYRTILSCNPTYGIWVYNGELVTYDGALKSSGVFIADGDWHHVAMTFQHGVASGTQFYVDGEPAGTALTFTDQIASIESLNIGSNVSNQFWDGEIDEVRVWSVVKTPTEIVQNYSRTITSGTGLVASYDFNSGVSGGNNSGVTTLADISGGGNDGALQDGSGDSGASGFLLSGNSSNWVASGAQASIQHALNFDGSDDEVSIGNLGVLPPQGTFEAWVNASFIDSNHGIFDSNLANTSSGFRIETNGAGDLYLYIDEESVFHYFFDDAVTPMPSNTWVHIAFSWNTGDNSLIGYVDGNVVFNDVYAALWPSNLPDFVLGTSFNSDPTRQWEGLMDEVRIWSEVRTQEDIVNNAYATINSDVNLHASYNFNHGVAASDNTGVTTLYDLSGNGFDGTLNGPFALIGSTSNWVTSTAWDVDVFAPLFDVGFPSVSDITENSFDITSSANESGNVYGVVLLDGAPAPTSAEVKAGTGQGGSPVQAFFNFGTNATANDVSGTLFGGTAYDVYVVAEDAALNVQPTPTLLDVTTLGTLQNSLSFDGVDDFVDIPDAASLDITGALTLETWVKFDESVPAEDIPLVSKWNDVGNQRSYVLQLSSSSEILFGVSATGSSAVAGTDISAAIVPFSFAVGKWYHIAGVFNPGSSMQVYVNGELVGENTADMVSSVHPGTSSVALAAFGNTFDNNGVSTGGAMELDETRIWSTNLDQATIQNQLSTELTGSEPNLVAYYDFNITSGTILTDRSTNSNDGTLYNNFDDGIPADGVSNGPIWSNSTVYDTDVVAPFNVPGYPFVDNITENGFEITTQLSEMGILSYVVLTDGASVPGKDDIRGGTGFLGAPAEASGTISVSSPLSEFSELVSGLSPSTNYDVYMVAEDLEGVPNVQNNVDFFDVTTNALPVQNALDFDGTDDYISGTGIDLSSSDFTVEAWFNTNDVTAAQSIFSLGSGGTNNQSLHINLEETQVLIGFFFDDVTIPYTVATGWNHIAVTHNATTRESSLYINGQFIGSGTHTGNFTGNTDFTISRNAWDGFTGFFDGQLDEIRVWNSIRNQTEIAQNRFMELDPGLHADLVAYYQFNELTGTNVPDVKNAFNGTWNGSGGGAYTAPQWIASTALDIPPHIVINTNDTGAGSLRDAITYANSNPGTTISFLIDEPSPWVIDLATALPQITAANTIIDGTTQPGWNFGDANGMVTINGSSLGTVNGININAADAEVYGLIFTEFNGGATNGSIYLATDNADNAIIGAVGKGNIFHNTDGNCIYVVSGDGAIIQGNRFGTVDGINLSGIGLSDHGIATTGEVTGITIGGDFFTGEGNLISGAGSGRYGINLNGSIGGTGLTNVFIRGNKIGTNEAANAPIANWGGINIQGLASNVNIGGSSPSDLNIISGNTSNGIRVQAGDDININGNYFGIQSDGSSALGNGVNGISIESAPTNLNIGDNYQNVISHNLNYGVFFNDSNVLNTTLGNNIIICNAIGGIGFIIAPATTTPTIQSMTTGGATVLTPGAADSSTVSIWVSDDGCNDNQAAAFFTSAPVSGGQADFITAFAPGAHYTATVLDPATGISEFSAPYFLLPVYPAAEGAGEALSFDGIDDEVTIPHNIDLNLSTRDFTIEAWINTSSTDGETILSKGEGNGGSSPDVFIFQKLSTGKLGLEFSNGSTSEWQESINDVPLDEWVHVAATYSSGLNQVTFYINGVQDGQFTYTLTPSDFGDTNPAFIGKQGYGCDCNYMNGEIDEIRIWDFVRSEVDIRADLAQKVTNIHSSYANLLAYYRMDDSGDGALSDVKGVHDGTINGATHVPSGAHLGDESSFDYTGLGFTFYELETRDLGSAGPMHVYRINQVPGIPTGSGLNDVTDGAYYGVFAPGINYNVVYYYSGLTADRRLVSRSDASLGWSDQSGFFGTLVGNGELVSAGISGSLQLATAIDPSPYPTEQGAGYALSFDGVDDYIDLGSGSQFLGHQNLTLEAWVNPDYTNISDHAAIISNVAPSSGGGGYQLSISSTNVRILYRDNTTADREIIAGPIPEGTWSHVAGVIENSGATTNLYLYVNGVEVINALGVTGVPDYTATSNMFIGSNSDGVAGSIAFDREFGGQLDEVRIWNTALAEEDIRQYMIQKLEAGHPSFANLVAVYKFDENDPNVAIDLAGGNDGTITGAMPEISGAPQGDGSMFSYDSGPVKFDTAPEDDVVVEIDDASNGFHIYYVGGTPNQDQAAGFNTITETKYYGVFAPGQTVDIRMDYNNGGSQDPDKRILYRENGADNAASGGWERLSGLLNNDPAIDSLYAFNVPSGEITITDLAVPSSYPLLGATDPGSALDFDGTDDYVQGPDLTEKITGDFTLEAWVNSSTAGAQNIVSIGNTGANGQQISLKFRSTNQLSITPNGVNGPSSGLANNDGSWHHIAGTYQGDLLSLYVDGVFIGSINTILAIDFSQFRIGVDSESLTQPLTGQIDEVRIWNTALSAGDIATYANTTDISTHPNYGDMVAYYKFDEGTGAELQDVFANNDGTWNGSGGGANTSPSWVGSGALADAPEQNALNFDATDDFVSFTRTALPNGLTYEAWINTSSTDLISGYAGNPALSVIGDNNNNIRGAFGINDGRVRYTHFTGSWEIFDGGALINDGAWHHIAVTHSSTTNEIRIYVDGVLDQIHSSSSYDPVVSVNRVGGSYSDGIGTGDLFDGDMDNVRVWDGVIAADDIRGYLYSTDLTGHPNEPALLLHYTMDQGSAGSDNSGITTLNDQTGGLNGTLNGFTLTGAASNFVSSSAFDHSGVVTPSTQATNINATNVTDNSVDISWTNGDGQRRIVAVFEGIETEMPIPSDNTFFNPDSNFGAGDLVDGSWHAVYNGFGNSVSVTGLNPGTDYTIAVLETNGPAWQEFYNINSATNNPAGFSTLAPFDPSGIYFTEASATDIYKLDLAGGIESSIASSNSGFGDYGIDYHPGTEKLYFIDGSSGGDKIMAVNPDGTDLIEFADLATSGTAYRGLGIDSLNNILYIASPAGLASFAIADGSPLGVDDVFTLTPYDIEVFEDHVYWSESGGGGTIYRANTGDIAGSVEIVMSGAASPGNFVQGIAIEPVERKIYWTNDNGEIRRADLDGANDEIVIDGLSTDLEDIEIDYESNRLIYVDNPGLSSTIVAANYDGTFIENLLVFSGSMNYLHVLTKPTEGAVVNFSEDFDNGLTATTDPSFTLSSGEWLAQGVKSTADIDPNLPRGSVGDAAYMFFGTGNFLISPYLTNVNEISFWYKADPVSAGTFDFEVYGSSDGGTTFDNLLSSGSTDGTDFIEFTYSFGSTYNGPIQIIYTGGGSESGVIDDFTSDGFVGIAPTLSGLNPIEIRSTDAEFEISVDVQSDLYYVVTFSATAPDANQIIAGLDELGDPAVSSNNFSNVIGTNEFNVGGLNPATNYYVHWVADNGGVYSNVLSYNFVSGDPPVNVAFGSVGVPGGNLAPGSTDNLIYTLSITPEEEVTTIGFILTLEDANYDPTDFPADPFTLWMDSDSDITGAIELGSYDFGGNIPDGGPVNANQVIFLFAELLSAGSPTYFFVTVDIAAGATPGNSFIPLALDPESEIGIEEEIIESGTPSAGNLFTISLGDVTAPNVVSVTPDLTVVKDGDGALSIVVIFDEAMTDDGSQNPVITFPVEDPSATLTDIGGVWNDAFEYEAFFSVTDANESIVDVDVRISAAQDAAGNTMTNHDETDVFSIDTENPTVLSITRASADPTNATSVDFTVTFSENVNDVEVGDFVLNTTGTAVGSISGASSASGSTITVTVNTISGDGTIRLDYSNTNLDGVVDDNGNPSESDFLSGEVYTIDNTVPTVAIDVKGTSITSPELTGTVDDPTASVEVTILSNTFAANNNGDGTWTLPQGTISPALVNGTYNVQVEATDLAGNVGSDATVDELVVQLGVTGLMVDSFDDTSITMIWDAGIDVDFYELDVSTVADFSTILSGYPKSIPMGVESESLTGLDYSDDYYFRIRLVNTAGEISANSGTVSVRTARDAATAADSVALRQIYDAIGGSAWTPAVNWTTEYMRDWDGITMDSERTRVDRLNISNRGASGNMPASFTGGAVGGLSAMTRMNVSNNTITGLVDLSGTSINNLNVSGNALEFDDLEPLIGIATLNYTNQASIQFDAETNPDLLSVTGDSILVPNTQNYILAFSTGGSANQYTWYLGDDVITTGSEFSVAGSALEIVTIDYDNMGQFRAEVNSTIVGLEDLTINVDPQYVLATAEVTMRLTDFDGVELTGETFQGALLEAIRREKGYDTLKRAPDVGASFVFSKVVLGDYLCGIDPDNEEDLIPTYFGNAFQWDEAETIELREDDSFDIVMTEVPRKLGPNDGEGSLDVLMEEDFGDEGGRVEARRRAAKRKCGLRRKRSGGRTGQDDDEFELIAYGETDDNGEFKFGFLPQGTYRFFVEYPGIPLDDASSVEFEVGEAGISDTDFKLEAFTTPDGIEITIEAVLGIILDYFKDLQIYPNPSSENLNIRYRHLKSKDVTAQLVDLSGNTMWSMDLRNGFDGELKMDVSEFEDGIYILRFYDREDPKGNVVSFRVIVRD
ncbi:MAG: LamG-like jellyroll fold domain-containing protein [Ekhidna sp.]|uniref:LamG-like jellyroll fold domain-containing protein n=1 Tax=Ekhidna sp. TaxID=2608089 RepID=UPI0032EFE43B